MSATWLFHSKVAWPIPNWLSPSTWSYKPWLDLHSREPWSTTPRRPTGRSTSRGDETSFGLNAASPCLVPELERSSRGARARSVGARPSGRGATSWFGSREERLSRDNSQNGKRPRSLPRTVSSEGVLLHWRQALVADGPDHRTGDSRVRTGRGRCESYEHRRDRKWDRSLT